MNIDERIATTAFYKSLGWLDELKVAPTPLPYGMTQRFKALIPERDMTELYERETCPYWWAYAATIQEFVALFEALPKKPFVGKKK